jgi:GntR family transcriptional regulator / MocR family aminotransferase
VLAENRLRHDAHSGGKPQRHNAAVNRHWTVQLEEGPAPLFLRIGKSVTDAIKRGRLVAGDALPSTRALAEQLGVHRKTVVAAYRELEREGWLATTPAVGTRVSYDLPVIDAPARSRAARLRAGFDLPARTMPLPGASPRGRLLLLGGLPETKLLPRAELARAYRRALLGATGRELLDYGSPQGDERLRGAVSLMLRQTRGVAAAPEALNIVRGTQQGLYLAARSLLEPGDRVAIEAYSHPSARGALQIAGALLEPVPVDEAGLDVDALDALCGRQRIKAVYVTPHHQLPTTVTMTAARRLALLALARRRRLLVLEDDYDYEFQYEGRPVLPLAYSDRDGVVVYFGSLSKVLAPGLRIGFVASTAEVAQRIAAYRAFVDHQGDRVVERAVAELIEGGELERHARRVRRVYRARRDALADALRRHLPALQFTLPNGGMAIWARAPGIDADAWTRRALREQVSFQAASHFACGRLPLDFVRLGFAACTEPQLAQAVQCMARALPARTGLHGL